MNKYEVIEILARERAVERLIENICHRPLSADLKDLSQIVYMVLLEYDEEKIIDLWNHSEMNFFLARIILNQYHSQTSQFYYTIRAYVQKASEISGKDWIDEAN